MSETALTMAERRAWHREFIKALGPERAPLLTNSEEAQARGLRSAGVSPTEAAVTIRLRLYERHGK